MVNKTVIDYVYSDDPLTNESFRYLINLKEEHEYIDFKQDFDHKSEKQWLELTKDIIAFSNGNGGYILFGVSDATFTKIGLDKETYSKLTRIDEIQQKINRYIDPPITAIRAKKFNYYKKHYVLIFVPENKNITHFISKDGQYRYTEGKLKGKTKNILIKGTSWIRRVGGNKLIDSHSIDEIFEKRFNYRKSYLLDNIAKVVDSPTDSEILIWSEEDKKSYYKKFIIEDAPDALPIKGMSFTTSPETIEATIAAWCALYKTNKEAIPPKNTLWKWYHVRKNISPNKKQNLHLFLFSVICDLPFFYWLRNIDSESIKGMILSVDKATKERYIKNLMGVSALLGKGFFNKIKKQISGNIKRLKPNLRNWYSGIEKEYFHSVQIESLKQIHRKLSKNDFIKLLEEELEKLTIDGIENKLGAVNLYKAMAIDCFLYARLDKYQNPICVSE